MKCKVAKWGNSYAVRLPKDVVDELDLHENSTLILEKKSQRLIFKKEPKQEKLRELLNSVEPQSEVDWGRPRGKEVW